MNKFEFENLSETPRVGLGKNGILVAALLLYASTNLAGLPWYAAKLGGKVAAARESYTQSRLDAETVAMEAAQDKQAAINAQADAQLDAAMGLK